MKIAGLILVAFAVLLVDGAGRAQEPPRSSQPARIEVKDLPRLFDPDKLDDPKAAAAAVMQLEAAFPGPRRPEAVIMLIEILRGSQLGGDNGWFGPAESRYTWKWLAKQCSVEAKKGISREKFPGTDAWFQSLDRNKDGMITAGDLDWSDRNPDVQMMGFANRLFRRLDADGNGKLTRDELLKFFEQAAKGKDHLTPDDLRAALLGGSSAGFLPGDAPTQAMLIRGLFEGSLGSMQEGPRVEERAPDFTLKTMDGKDTVHLAKLIGPKPVVLVLGNYTCSPFRSLYAALDGMHQKYKGDANFLMVYVREAHPTDGWKMASNAKVGVAVKQPTSLAERVAVADQFCAKLKPTMPFVVDDVNDAVGNAYSGMPGRVYVIDCQGKVAYKSGRGPFGFRLGEMEQAIVMALLERSAQSKTGAESLK